MKLQKHGDLLQQFPHVRHVSVISFVADRFAAFALLFIYFRHIDFSDVTFVAFLLRLIGIVSLFPLFAPALSVLVLKCTKFNAAALISKTIAVATAGRLIPGPLRIQIGTTFSVQSRQQIFALENYQQEEFS